MVLANHNRQFPSCHVSLGQNESLFETIHLTMTCAFILMQVKLRFCSGTRFETEAQGNLEPIKTQTQRAGKPVQASHVWFCLTSDWVTKKKKRGSHSHSHSHRNFSWTFLAKGERCMRLTLCEAPTRETRPDHNTGNFIPYSFR